MANNSRFYRLSFQTPSLTPQQLGQILMNLPEGSIFLGLDGSRPVAETPDSPVIQSAQPRTTPTPVTPTPVTPTPAKPPAPVALHASQLVSDPADTPTPTPTPPAVFVRRARKEPTPARVHLSYSKVPVAKLPIFQKLAKAHDAKLDIFRLPGTPLDSCSVIVNFPRSRHYTSEVSRDRFEEAYKFAPLNETELGVQLRTVSDASVASLASD